MKKLVLILALLTLFVPLGVGAKHVSDVNPDLIGGSTSEPIVTCSGKETIAWLQKMFDLIKIAGPILVVALGSYDYVKAIYSSNDDALQKSNKKFLNRVIAAVLIFLLPAVLSFILKLAGDKYGAHLCGIK